jgi:cytochrome b
MAVLRPNLHVSSAHRPAEIFIVPVIRAGALVIALLLVLAYATGEEFQHTHAPLGYGLAALLAAWICWELIRPHDLRSATFAGAISAAARAASSPFAAHSSAPALLASVLLLLVGALALVALAMLWLAHWLWTPAGVDEAHEAIAYLSLGLAIVFIALVIFAASQQADRLFAKSRN